jgi:hypothetical protein
MAGIHSVGRKSSFRPDPNAQLGRDVASVSDAGVAPLPPLQGIQPPMAGNPAPRQAPVLSNHGGDSNFPTLTPTTSEGSALEVGANTVTDQSAQDDAEPEISIILSDNRFYPSKIHLHDGQKVRLIFTTLNPKPAALMVETLNIQKWIGGPLSVGTQPGNRGATSDLDPARSPPWELCLS